MMLRVENVHGEFALGMRFYVGIDMLILSGTINHSMRRNRETPRTSPDSINAIDVNVGLVFGRVAGAINNFKPRVVTVHDLVAEGTTTKLRNLKVEQKGHEITAKTGLCALKRTTVLRLDQSDKKTNPKHHDGRTEAEDLSLRAASAHTLLRLYAALNPAEIGLPQEDVLAAKSQLEVLVMQYGPYKNAIIADPRDYISPTIPEA